MKTMTIETAPLAGFTDAAFRRVLIRCGAKVVWTEMVSATALFYKSKKTLELLKFDKHEDVKTVVQLFGKTPEHFTYAIQSGHLDAFDEININMGCPAPKIVKNGEGSALMKNPELARKIIKACVVASEKPVSVKMRIGWSEGTPLVPEFAKMCEQAGASRIIVHGRYTSQGYSGKSDWDTIAKVVKSVTVPVVANGDIVCRESAEACLKITSASGLMVGRALLGSPWKIGEIQSVSTQTVAPNKSINTKEVTLPTDEIKKLIKFHIDTAREIHTDGSFPEIKKHLLFYCSNLPDSKELKKQIATSKTFDEAIEILSLCNH